MKQIDARASVFLNEKFFNVCTFSQGMLAYLDPDAKPNFLSSTVDNKTLGKTLREALKLSKRVDIFEFNNIFNSGIIKALAQERDDWAMQHYGYTTKQAMYKKMECCWVSVFNKIIEIKPTHHKRLDNYSGISNDGPEILYLPINIDDEKLGKALREAFKNCVKKIK